MRRVGRSTRVAMLLAMVAALLAPHAAFATLDPARAEADAKAIIADNHAFCTHPKRPLTPAARRFCPNAAELPECTALQKVCADERSSLSDSDEKRDSDKDKSSSRTAISAAIGNIAQVLVWMLLAALVVIIVVPIVQAILRRRRDAQLAETVVHDVPQDVPLAAVVELPPDDAETLLRRAEEHARGGRLDAALYTYLFAALRALDGRGAIRIAKHRTNGEYIRFCKDPDARAPLREIVNAVELVRFGGRPATSESVGHAAQRATWLVRAAAPIVTTLVVGFFALSVAGCGGGTAHDLRASLSANDPAGNEIFTELLRKQGLKVETLETSLGALPIPEDDEIEKTPAVVIDLARVDMEPDVEAHLEKWVEAGGMLVLAGDPIRWPLHMHAARAASSSNEIQVFAPEERTLDDEDDDQVQPQPLHFRPGTLVAPAAMTWTDEDVVVLATTKDDKLFAAARPLGRGSVLAMASNDLIANAGLARGKNPTALVAVFASLGRTELCIARAEDGIAPPSNPFSGILRAGLGLPMWHALAFSLVLFAAVGMRLARPRPTPIPRRRAFAEHVAATGAFYARVGAARHALAAFARYARDKLRAVGAGGARTFARGGGGRGGIDPALLLAQRTGKSPEECAAVWGRASEAVLADQDTSTAPARGDELATLRELSALLTEATKTK